MCTDEGMAVRHNMYRKQLRKLRTMLDEASDLAFLLYEMKSREEWDEAASELFKLESALGSALASCDIALGEFGED